MTDFSDKQALKLASVVFNHLGLTPRLGQKAKFGRQIAEWALQSASTRESREAYRADAAEQQSEDPELERALRELWDSDVCLFDVMPLMDVDGTSSPWEPYDYEEEPSVNKESDGPSDGSWTAPEPD